MTNARNVKVVLVGDMCVGKTSLSSVFVYEVFRERYSLSVGGAFMAKTLPPPINTTLQIWDTAGMERFRAMLPHFVKDAHCAIIVYDVSERGSFMSVQDYWIDYVTETANRDNIVRMLVANKVDLPRDQWTVTESEGRRLAERHGIPFVCTSAKQGLNVKELFQSVATEIKQKIPAPEDEHEGTTYLEPLGPRGTPKWSCCWFS